jgi:L-histidine N-alpha-methyltransferase
VRDALTISSAVAQEVLAGLTKPGQKELPSKYLYDPLGSRLFDAITELPEYGLTRAEERILAAHARDVVARLPKQVIVAELGSGTGRKTRRILEALSRRRPTAYYPIEISHDALVMCEREMNGLPSIGVVGLERDYLDGLLEVAARRSPEQRILVLFLGSTIGNFDRPASTDFLREVRRMLEPGDRLLLGTDLMKPIPVMLAAYDDPLGVTAAFNLNLLARVNREMDGNFDLRQFVHEARFNARARSIEMHLRSLRAQTVTVAETRITFRAGETIWTEASHKYTLADVHEMAQSSGFRCDEQWIDSEWPFADSLWVAE